MSHKEYDEELEFSFKSLFVPLTTLKAIHWIIAVGIIVYCNSWFGGPVWDDMGFVFGNQSVETFNFFSSFGNNFFTASGFYRPMVNIIYSLLYVFFQQQTFFYHFIQTIFHITNAIILMIIFSKFFKRGVALSLSLVFLVHPINVEAVSYISGFVDVLIYFFGLLTLLVVSNRNLSKISMLGLAILFLTGLLLKELMILFIIFGVLYTCLFEKQNITKTVLAACVSLFVYTILRAVAGGFAKSEIISTIASLRFLDRILLSPQVFLYYLKTFFFPASLAIDQHWNIHNTSGNTIPAVIFSLIFIIAVVGFGIFFLLHKKERAKEYIFFSVWFFVAISMFIQVYPLDLTVAERWFYTPIAGLLGILGVLYSAFQNRLQKGMKMVVLILFLVCTMLLSVRTMVRNTNWHDAFTLYQHDVKVTESYELENNLATELINRGRFDDALIHERKSFQLFPIDINSFNLGAIYQHNNDKKKAEMYYSTALKIKGHTIDGHRHDTAMYIAVDEFVLLYEDSPKGSQMIREGVKDYPENAVLFTYLALEEYKLHNLQNAKEAIDKAYKLSQSATILSYRNKIYQSQPIQLIDASGR